MHTQPSTADTGRMDGGPGTDGRFGNPVALSTTIQTYRGTSYYLCEFYYQKKGRRLHREIWKDNNGPIPAKYHVHHIDGNRSNNALQNLTCIPGSEHLAIQSSNPTDKQREARANNARGPCAAGNLRMSKEQRSAASRGSYLRRTGRTCIRPDCKSSAPCDRCGQWIYRA